MRAHPAVICTMIAVGGYILSTAAGLGVVTQLLVGDKGPGGLLVSIALAAVGCLLLGYGVRLGVRRTSVEPPTVQPVDRPPQTDYSSLPSFPSQPPARKPW